MIQIALRPGTGKFRFVCLAMSVATVALTACQADAPQSPTVNEALIDRTDDPIVAQINGDPVYASDVIRAAIADGRIGEAETLDPTSEGFAVTRDALIDQRLLAREALAQGLDQTDEGQRRLRVARDRVLGNLAVEERLAADVTETAIRDLYDAQNALAQQGPERRLRHILTGSEEAAQAALEQLAAGEPFEAVALAVSIDADSRARGGRLGWRGRASVSDRLETAIFTAPLGERLGPIESEAGWHIIDVLEARTPGARPFEEVEDDLERFLTYRALDTLITELREEADLVLIAPEDIAHSANSAKDMEE